MNYQKAYAQKKEVVYKDTSLVYIPEIVNLVKNVPTWDSLTLSEHRAHFWEFFSEPVLANVKAYDLNKGERYCYPMGMMFGQMRGESGQVLGEFANNRVDDISGPEKQLSIEERALIDFLNTFQFDYIFTITNVGTDYKWLFWSICGDTISVILYDNTKDRFYSQDATLFLENEADWTFFDPFYYYVVRGIPDDVQYVRVFTQEKEGQWAVSLVRFEDKTGNPVYFKLNKKLTKPIKNYPIEKVTFDGFVLDHTGPAAEDTIHRQAMVAAQSYGHIYGDRDSQPVYYYVRHTPSPR